MQVVFLLLLVFAAHTTGVSQQYEVRDVIKYEKGDCLYETVTCMYDDSCGPLLRLVYAYCYETIDYSQERSDGSRLACDSSCAMLLSVLFSTTAGIRLKECNYSSHQFWAAMVIQKQRQCAPLSVKTDLLLRHASGGKSRTECWLTGLLCVRDFSCRSTLIGVLDLPCYEGPCDPKCAIGLTGFAGAYRDVFHSFQACLCGRDLVDACRQPLSGYINNRSAALDSIVYMSPLDALIEQLGRRAIKDQVKDSIWLLKVFEHPYYCQSLKAMAQASCMPTRMALPTATETLCTMEPVFEAPMSPSTVVQTTEPISTARSSTTPPAEEPTDGTQVIDQTQQQQPTKYPINQQGNIVGATVAGAHWLQGKLTSWCLSVLTTSLLTLTTQI